MVKLKDNDIEKIITFKNKFLLNNNTNNRFYNGSLSEIQKSIETQREKIEKIETLINSINSRFQKSDFKSRYINFLKYIQALINAKIQKDEDITKLLEKVFETIGEYIEIIKTAEFTLKETFIEELIDIDNVNTSMNVSDLIRGDLLSEKEKEYALNGKVNKDGLTGFINAMISDCKETLERSIDSFQTELGTINKTGGEGEIVAVDENYNEGDYKEKFNQIKVKYETELKDNIKLYKDICNVLINKDHGLVTTVINSLKTIITKEKKINKKFKIDLNYIFSEDNPFAANKAAFETLKQEIYQTKNELLNTPVRQNTQNPKRTQVSNQAGIQGITQERIQEGTQVNISKQGEDYTIGPEIIRLIDQPLRHSFANFLYNLNNETTPVLLTAYKRILSQSLTNINEALERSMEEEGSTRIKTSSPNSYIAYVFGWIDPETGNSDEIITPGEWKPNGLGDDKKPTEIIKPYITILDGDNITKYDLINITINMIKLLQHENLHIEKGSTTQGEDNKIKKFKNEELKNFKPKLELLKEQTDGGYKKKSKSKKMTSKKKSMKVAKKTSSKAKENKNKNKKIVKSYSKSKSKKQSGGFIRGGVLFPQDFYDTSTVM